MNKFLQKLTRQNKIKKLKLELKETRLMLEKQISQNLKQDRHLKNMAKRMRDIDELAKVNVLTSSYAERVCSDLTDVLSAEYGKVFQSDIKIVNSANKIRNIVDRINEKRNIYGVEV